MFKYGPQPLHILIRVAEWVLKISYHVRPSSEFDIKKHAKDRQKLLHDRIKAEFGINVDVPSIKNGRTTDGNMCRLLFSNYEQFSSLIDLDSSFVKNIACLLACVSSHRKVSSASI